MRMRTGSITEISYSFSAEVLETRCKFSFTNSCTVNGKKDFQIPMRYSKRAGSIGLSWLVFLSIFFSDEDDSHISRTRIDTRS